MDIRVAEPSEVSQDFLQKMVDRMAVALHRYGPVAEVPLRDVDALASALTRIAKYQETGNTEWLVDAANFMMIEFLFPSHPESHFRATESDESPGRVERVED